MTGVSATITVGIRYFGINKKPEALASWCATMSKLGRLRPPKMAACHPSWRTNWRAPSRIARVLRQSLEPKARTGSIGGVRWQQVDIRRPHPRARTGRVDVSGYGFRGNLAEGNWSLCNRVDHKPVGAAALEAIPALLLITQDES